ncbi:MAG: HAMP domain-containing histidine kinase [Chloroflexota bacterium]|nr:MAG: HAMP domain-containing histidine kinase [Chloroflexota bacterium]
MPDSIRWRLPLSYGLIAFLTVVSLGGVLLLMLNSFYAAQERRYLEQNAPAVGEMVGGLIRGPSLDSLPRQDLLQSQVNSLAYLTQTRIQIFDPDGALMADSGDPQKLRVASTLSLQLDLGDEDQTFSQSIGRTAGDEGYTTALVIEDEGGRFESQTTVSGSLVDPAAAVDGQALTQAGLQPPSALGLADEPGFRSAAVVQQPILELGGRSVGQLVLSQGPAFGRSLLAGVARALVVAGLVAVLLAAAAGWLVSRRLTRPVLELVEVTEQMSAGELAVRADISRGDELGQLAQSFNKMAERIEATVATLRNFVADAAHEMNTPLTALRTNLELAARADDADPLLASAMDQATRLEQLNDDLVQLSRIEGGIGLESVEPVDLGRRLLRLSERYAAQAEQAGLAFEMTMAEPMPERAPERAVIVEGDEELLARAVNNLVDNAVKFTPQGGRVTLTLGGDGSWVTITVADTGIGIEEDDLNLVFGRFHRGRNAAEYPGSGLGLAISQSIIDAHGGRIEIASQPGRTQVRAFLPAKSS